MSGDKPKSSCAICGDPITAENDSKEHLIPEAIGGRLKVKGFICRHCNNNAGSTWDAKLSAQLHPLSLLFGVERQRGTTPGLAITTTAGEELTMKPGGGFVHTKPSFLEEAAPEGVKIQIAARSMEEAKRILAGVKRKYPNIDVDHAVANAQAYYTYPKGMVQHQLEFGGEVSGRSIVKSALALAHHAGIPVKSCEDALNYLRDPAATPCFGYYYASDLVTDRSTETPLHCVSIEANPDTGMILGYAEYFGIQRAVVCLGRNYVGDPRQACYAIDPRTGGQLDLSIHLSFSEMDLEAIYDYRMVPDGAIVEAFNRVVPEALKRKHEGERDRVISQAVEYGFANCGAKPGEILTEAHVKKLSGLIIEKMMPFILHNLARQEPVPPPGVDQGEEDEQL